MAGKAIENAHMSRLDKFGEDVIFDDIAEGMKIRDLIKKYGVGNRGFYSWLKKADGRRERYRQAQVRQAQMYAEECISIADATADAQEAQVSKLRIDARKFMASKLDPSVYGDQRAPLVNITVGSTHLNAIKDLATSPVTIEQVDDE